MSKNLVIVESPAKAKTIKKFLGSNYQVVASNGHVRDLPKSQMGIDENNDFDPKYITIRGKGDILSMLRKEVKKADKVYLATDPDREGEAISWHLAQILKLDTNAVNRITFNEVTKNAVKNSIKEARVIDMNLVDAQQTRRILDRMVGYKISPLLWKKVKRGLSAGRVQSVVLRIVCDREEEINAFVPTEYWTLEAVFEHSGKNKINAKFYGTPESKIEISTEQEMQEILKNLEGAEFSVTELKRGERQKKAPNPFTTSTLQQEASKQLNFSTQKTMRVAQQLYEGVDIAGHGTIGLITYLRTDSIRVSDEANAAAKEYISQNYGDDYYMVSEHKKSTDKKVQDAHEAIRPTYIELTPAEVKDSLTREQFRLYQLIWKRFVASRMQSAKYDTVSAKIDGAGYRFTASTTNLAFKGFLTVYNDEEEVVSTNNGVQKLEQNAVLSMCSREPLQHFTQPAPHYTEASLVREIEELGIGRPSTYATTVTTILARRYIIKEDKNLYVTELGEAVNDIMKTAFPSIVDVNFTANMEYLLDSVEEGTVAWKTVVRNFYPDLEEAVKNAQTALEKVEINDEETDVVCEECGRNMVIKYGKHGKFLACPGFPECKNTKTFLEKTGVQCPKCGADIVVRRTKKGRRYFGCENAPECDYMSWQKPSAEEKKDN